MHPFFNILLCQRFNNLHSLSPYDPILFSNSDYNLLQVHLKLPLKYIEVEIDYLNLFMACTYAHLCKYEEYTYTNHHPLLWKYIHCRGGGGGGAGEGRPIFYELLMALYFFKRN